MNIEHIENSTWTPIRTKPKMEKKLEEFAKANLVPVYLPLIKKVKRYVRSTAVHYKPMFPGYIFAAINQESYATLLRANRIVFKIDVDEVGEIQLIGELNKLKKLESYSETKDLIVEPGIKKGTTVMISHGAMKGMVGIVEKRKGKTMLTINIEMLGQSVSTELDIGYVEIDEV